MDAIAKKFSSLSIKDLLDAREAYHVHLAHLEGVYATAIGRYLIRVGEKRGASAADKAKLGPRRLDNCVVEDWSWPCVLVFVRKWLAPDQFEKERAQDFVPSRLYMPDGRVVPTCVVEVDPDSSIPVQPPPPQYKSDLMGGGYPVTVDVQGKTHVGSVGCLVTDGDAVYALTNRHVTGEPGRVIHAGYKNPPPPIGVSDAKQIGKKHFASVYPGWPGGRVFSNLDAGLIRIDSVLGWTAQVYGMGEIDAIWDLNVDSFSLDVIGCPVAAFGAASGEMKGRILGLFYRYKTVGGYEYVSDFAIGPRAPGLVVNNSPGDSGTLWFEDRTASPDLSERPPLNANGAPRRRPFALEWGGQVLLAPGGHNSTQLALASCLSTICRELDVELIPDWNTGHTEYWGEWGHTKIGAYACEQIDKAAFPALAALMEANADRIGLPNDELQKWTAKGDPAGHSDFSPLADVADLVWRTTRPNDASNHFADMDKPDPQGQTLLDLSVNKADVTPEKWNAYYASVGENKRGALPFRVWQIFEEMVGYAKDNKILEFVTAGGLMAHYVGDACQPLHVSQYHHGRAGGDKAHMKVHSLYETTMIGRYGKDLLPLIDAAQIPAVAPVGGNPPKGQDVAFAVTELMRRTVARLPPLDIVDLFDSHMGSGAAPALWDAFKAPTAACMKDGAKTLARIWEAAWEAGGLTAAAADTFSESDMEALYRKKCFCPSYALAQVTLGGDGRLVLPPCIETGGGTAAPAAARRRAKARPARPAAKTPKKAVKKKVKKKVVKKKKKAKK